MGFSVSFNSFGNMPPRGVDPDTYAQQYADKKGISLEEAKQELRSKFGDPKKPKESQQTDETSALFVKAQTPISPRGVDSDTYAQQYADKKGISLEEVKQELRTKFGDPKQPEATNDSQLSFGGSSKMPPEEYELLLRGIPLSVIEQGDDAIKNYADENNIELPEKKVGRSLDIFV